MTSEGESWLRHRRLIQPLFSRQRIEGYADIVPQYTRRMLEGWKDGEHRDIHGEMGKLALEVIAKVLFDADVANDATHVGEALTVVMYNFLNRWGSLLPLPANFPTPGNLRYFRSIRQLDEILYRFIRERRESKEQKEDLLSVLLRARDEDGESMSDKQLRDEAMTLFLAGHETTANAMGFTWYLLAQYPEVVEKLRNEVATVVSGPVPTAADVANLKYTEAVILESMRLYPPAYAQGRIPHFDMEMNGFRIPANSTVLVSQWIMHRDPRWWEEAKEFRPERWLDGSTKDLPKFAYIPFGGGARLCIGNNFAMMETVLILATMIREVSMELLPDQDVKLRAGVTLKPEFGIQVKLNMRHSVAVP